MSPLNYPFLFEALGFISFTFIVIREMRRRGFLRLFEITSCAVFGMMLEIINTHLAHTYSYGQDFMVNVAQVPVVIGLGWAVIVYCAMLLSDRYNMPWVLHPFVDALIAVIIDLAMDPVAIRIGLWKWIIPLDKEWFGVPFENFVGWILVVLCFSFLVRFIRTLDKKLLLTKLLMLLSPVLSFVGLIFGLITFSFVSSLPYQLSNRIFPFKFPPSAEILSEPQVVLWKATLFAIIMAALIFLAFWPLKRYGHHHPRNFDPLSLTLLTSICLFFVAAIFSAGIYRELPILILISSGSLFLHLAINIIIFRPIPAKNPADTGSF